MKPHSGRRSGSFYSKASRGAAYHQVCHLETVAIADFFVDKDRPLLRRHPSMATAMRGCESSHRRLFFGGWDRLFDMGCKSSGPLFLGYDPECELGQDHLARFIDSVVELVPCPKSLGKMGQPGYDPRMLAKVSMYGYATGVHSSRRLEQNCKEHLAFMFLARDDRPSYHTLSSARVDYREYFERIWLNLLGLAACNGITLLGRIAIDCHEIRGELFYGADN